MRKEATEGLLKAIKDSEKPGKWQMLIDAFERVGVCVGCLLGWLIGSVYVCVCVCVRVFVCVGMCLPAYL